jgi:hypothetical protein
MASGEKIMMLHLVKRMTNEQRGKDNKEDGLKIMPASQFRNLEMQKKSILNSFKKKLKIKKFKG